MKKTLLMLTALLLLSPLVPPPAEADHRGSLTISATFGNLDLHPARVVYAPGAYDRPAPRVVVVHEVRHEKKWRHGRKHQHDDRFDCDARHDRRSGYRYREPRVVYYPDYPAPGRYERY